MPRLVFYRQQRRDDAIRTAVTIDDETVLHRFERGKKPSDPALLWYVDVRCEGPRLPREPEQSRRWLLDQAEVIRSELFRLADDLQAGLDVESWPLEREVSEAPRNVRMKIVCSAVRRLELLQIATILRDLADHWEEILRHLPTSEPTLT